MKSKFAVQFTVCVGLLSLPAGAKSDDGAELLKLEAQFNALYDAGRYREAEPLGKRMLAIAEKSFKNRTPVIATCLDNLANLYDDMGRYAEAEPLFLRSLKIREAKRGPDDPDVAKSLNNLANHYKDMGKYAKAEPLYMRSLKIKEAKLGPDHPDVALALNNIAVLYDDMSRYAEAEPLFQRSLNIRQAKLGPDHPDVAETLNNLANLYQTLGKFTKAEPFYQRSLKIFEAKLGQDHIRVAQSLNNLAALYNKMGQYAKAETLYQRSLKIKESKLGPEHLDVAGALNNLAALYNTMGRYADAEPLYQRSLKIHEAKLGTEHPLVATSLNNLAALYDDMGRYADAEPLYQRSLKIREAKLGPDHPDVGLALNNLAALYVNMGQYAQAEPLHQRSLKIKEAKLGADHPDVAMALNNLAALYKDMGRYADAEPLYQRSLKIREAKLGPDHPDVADSLNGLGLLYAAMGQYAKAELVLKRNLTIKEAKLGPEHRDAADSLNSLAMLYVDMGQYAKAEPLYQRSLKIYEAKLGPDHPEIATSLNNLANLYQHMGHYTQAEPLYERSLTIREAKLGADHPAVASSLNNLATLYKNMGQHAQAEPLYQRSLVIDEAKLGPDHPEVARDLNNLAALYIAMGYDDKAAQEVDLARRIVRKYVARVLPVLSAREQMTLIQRKDEREFHFALTLGWLHADDPTLVKQSTGWVVNGKAVVQESLAEQSRLARDSQDPTLAEQGKRLTAVRNQLAALSQVVPKAGKEADHRKHLADLATEEQELSRQVNLAAGRPALDEPWVETADVRRALADGAVLVDIVRFRPYIFEAKHGETYWQPARYVAWVVPSAGRGPATGQNNVRIVDLGQADEIDQAVEQARQAIRQSAERNQRPENDEEPAELAAMAPLTALAKLVLAPLLPALGDAKELVLSPDSQLWLAPWAALPVEEGQYAIERWRLRYVTNGRDVVLARLASTQLGGTLKARTATKPGIFADPDYNLDGKAGEAATRAVLRGREKELATRGAVGVSRNRLDPARRLPATADEARLITPSLTTLAHEAPTVYSGKFALEGVLKVLASPRVLVLSTHGFYFPEQEAKKDERRDMLAGGDSRQDRGALLATDGTPLENPLLRCGVLLAGCNQPRGAAAVDDGVVTGMEIVGCDLRGTELVVLSACDTGLGQVRNGEGVAGLRQAFQLAGAKAVVSTLWRIPDAETAELMSDFFGHMAEGQSKAEALRAAQLAQIKARRHEYGAAHPYYWAAFTVTGN